MAFEKIDRSAKELVLTVQDYFLFSSRAALNLFSRPLYWADFIVQSDIIGVGSATIVIFAGFFTGGVLAVQSAATLASFGATAVTGRFVAMSISGRNASSMASELGSMVVTEQIDAMRALGVDPIRKLVTPRIFATVAMLFFLTIVSDFCGILGGAAVTVFMNGQNGTQYFSMAYEYLHYPDILQGLVKPLMFGFLISSIGCFYGMRTTGGTQGVGRSTIQAVVWASVMIIFSDLLVSILMVSIFS
jgi:phospholipid/cholesterol/gamma-HCH transport system permease protein